MASTILPPDAADAELSEAIRFVIEFARALHRYGTTAHRLENALQGVATHLGLEAQFFSTPTAVFLSAGLPNQEARTVLIRVEPGELHLERLALLDSLATEVVRGTVAIEPARRRIVEIVDGSNRYGDGLRLLCAGLASATAARFLGGGWREVVSAAGIGLLIGLFGTLTSTRPRAARLFEPMSAALASFLSAVLGVAFHAAGGRLSTYIVMLAALITLVPGLTLTLAMSELSTRDLSSGSARLASALMTFFTLAFGVALGAQLATLALGVALPTVAPQALPAWTEMVALLVAPFGYVVLLRASPRDTPWILLAGGVAYVGVRVGAAFLGAQLGAFVGAVAVGAGSNIYARWLDRPAAVTLVPGILFLVPGSIGFQSLSSLLASDVVSGIETAFRMTLVAIALVAGLLVANVVVPPRQTL
jgi:uncharacterized membrane protein YjjP (DUF1212 family)